MPIFKISKKVPGLLLALFILQACFSSTSEEEPLVVHLIDTDFCPEVLGEIPEGIEFVGPHNHSNVIRPGTCQENLSSRRYHGQRVLERVISQVSKKSQEKKVEIHLHIVFDKDGQQDPWYWKRALEFIQESEGHLVGAALGLPFSGDPPGLDLPGTAFVVASGNVGKKVRKSTKLWPQALAPRENLYLVGSYVESSRGRRKDKTLLYSSQIDLYFPDRTPKSLLRGSSLSLATGIGQLIDLCRTQLLSAEGLENCPIFK